MGDNDVKPAPFDYHAPASVAEALAILDEFGDDAAILAGGQSLVPLLNLRLARPSVVVDINGVAELDSYTVAADAVTVGATVRARRLEHDDEVAAALPLLRQAVRLIAHPQIRSRTTIGGNIAHADPAAELPTVLTALDGRVSLESSDGSREVAADEFFQGPMTTARQPTEIVTHVHFPVRPAMRWGFDEVVRRAGDFAMIGACVGVACTDGAISDAVVALAGCASHPLRCETAAAALIGRGAHDDLGDVATAVSDSISPSGDIHASGEYRRVVAGRVVRRLTEGLLRAAA